MPEDLQHALGLVLVLHTDGRDDHGQDQPERIDEEVAFVPFDIVVRVVAIETP